jgi:hypothetical protein
MLYSVISALGLSRNKGFTQRHDQWEDNDASDYSLENDVPQSGRYDRSVQNESSYTPLPPKRSSSSNRERPSGIPRPGSHTPSRLPSAMNTPRSRSYSSSSADSQVTKQSIIPPMPQIPTARGRSGVTKTNQEFGTRTNDSYPTAVDYSQPRSHANVSRRPTAVSRPRSRSYSRAGSVISECPPPLPGSNSDSDSVRELEALSAINQDLEPTPKRTPWAKDRRRFANPDTSAGSGAISSISADVSSGRTSVGTRYDQPPTPVAYPRKSSLKAPSDFRNSVTPSTAVPSTPGRMPSAAVKPSWGVLEERLSSDYEEGARANSRADSSIITGNTKEVPSHGDNVKSSLVSFGRNSFQRAPVAGGSSRVEPVKSSDVEAESAKPLRSRNRYSSVHSKGKPEESGKAGPDLLHISSIADTPLPTPPLPQFDTHVKSRTPRQDRTGEVTRKELRSETISSPVETMLIGPAPGAEANVTPNSRRMSTPVRSVRESSVYIASTPAASRTPGARRLSEPSPNKGTPGSSTKDQSSKDQEPPQTIFQRLARRASLSTGKSPKPGGTPKSPKGVSTPKSLLDVEHDPADSPFGLDLETPRATTGTGTGPFGCGRVGSHMAREELSERQKNRQSNVYQSSMYSATPINEPRKPRSKAVEEDSAEKLGSPFMGDGSPRFGIDERFRSPKKRTKSGLRTSLSSEVWEDCLADMRTGHNAFNDSHKEKPQELFNYHVSNEVVENATDYLAEGLPIATVLSSPRESQSEMTPRATVPPSPVTQSRRRSQYQYTSRLRTGVDGKNGNPDSSSTGTSTSESRIRIPVGRSHSQTPSFIPSVTTTRSSARSSLGSSSRSQFSDSSDEQESRARNHSTTGAYPTDRKEQESRFSQGIECYLIRTIAYTNTAILLVGF